MGVSTLLLVDREGVVVDANSVALKTLARARTKVVGEPLTEEQYGQGAAATSLFFVDFIAPPREWGVRLSFRI